MEIKYYKEFESNHNNYMFFQNLKILKDISDEILNMNQEEIDKLIDEKHDWIEDHVSTAKESVSQVYDFLKNK